MATGKAVDTYLDGALALAQPGATLVFDNMVRDGAVADATNIDLRVSCSPLQAIPARPRARG